MYSQNDEEQFVVDFYKGRVGRFLDIGAYDGIGMSNTRRLMELGWTGVLVEPNPASVIKLMENNRQWPDRVTIVQAAVSGVSGLIKLEIDEEPNREWSATVNDGLLKSGSVMKPHPVTCCVQCVTLARLFRRFGHFDFLSIDAEWEDMYILRNSLIEIKNSPTSLICIEPRDTHERNEMKSCFDQIGFKTVHETPENLLVARA